MKTKKTSLSEKPIPLPPQGASKKEGLRNGSGMAKEMLQEKLVTMKQPPMPVPGQAGNWRSCQKQSGSARKTRNRTRVPAISIVARRLVPSPSLT